MKSKSARRSVRPDKTSRRRSQRLGGEHGWNSASRRSKPMRSMLSTTSTSASAANKQYEGARPVPREMLQNLGVWCGLSAAENGLQNEGGGIWFGRYPQIYPRLVSGFQRSRANTSDVIASLVPYLSCQRQLVEFGARLTPSWVVFIKNCDK